MITSKSNKVCSAPPMGWNSYDYYDTTVNEEQIRANADYMAKNLKEYGWEYIVVDIAWYNCEAGQQREKYQYVPFCKVEMDEYSRLLPCVERFPSAADGKGFGPLAEYVHSLGLKFGIHIMRGIPRAAAYRRTAIKGTKLTANQIANPYSICSWNPDMYGVDPDSEGAQAYYDSLMELYAEWGVDFVKCDDICRMDAESSRREIELIHKAIEWCGRGILLSLSPGPALVEEAEFYHKNANMWRITDDFWDHWESLRDMFDRCRNWQEYVRERGYPDCDMLPLGWIGKGFGTERQTNFTRDEQRTMMTLWCLFRSPLMLGAELTKLDEWTLSLLRNRDLLHLLNGTEGAREVWRDEDFIIWHTKDTDGENEYAAIFHISERDVLSFLPESLREGRRVVTELWSGEEKAADASFQIPAHGVALVLLHGRSEAQRG